MKTSLGVNIFNIHLHNRGIFPHLWLALLSSCQRSWSFSVRTFVLFCSSIGRRSDCSKGREFPFLKVSVIQWNDKREKILLFSRCEVESVPGSFRSLLYLPFTDISLSSSKSRIFWLPHANEEFHLNVETNWLFSQEANHLSIYKRPVYLHILGRDRIRFLPFVQANFLW